MLRELRCPSCGAPVKSASSQLSCQFCDARLVRSDAAAAETEKHYSITVAVAPSNRARVAGLIHVQVGLALAEATEQVANGPFEIALGTDKRRADELLHALEQAGARATLNVREVPIPLADVVLEAAGEKPLAVIVVLRSEFELSVPETKALLERAPVLIASALKLDLAETLVERLTQAGARARLSKCVAP